MHRFVEDAVWSRYAYEAESNCVILTIFDHTELGAEGTHLVHVLFARLTDLELEGSPSPTRESMRLIHDFYAYLIHIEFMIRIVGRKYAFGLYFVCG
jgi:hypothetical protein